MRIKRYTALTMHEALEQVRREMGDGALIVQTRRLRPWWWPWARARVEVIAATDPRPAWDRAADVRAAARPRAETAASSAATVSASRSAYGAAVPGARARAASPSRPPARDGWGRQEATWFERLVGCDVEASLAWEVVHRAALSARASGQAMEQALVEQVGAAVRTMPLWERGAAPRFVMLVGPTGVGKTTTLAKLAANFALIGGWDVGLVTTDTFRIGAIQQLRTYADLVGLPLWVARDAEELRSLCRGARQELVLIDTAGHSPGDQGKLEEVSGLARALPGGSMVLLVVPAGTRQEDLAEVVEAYRPLPLSGVIVTKVDETRRRGVLLNAPRWTGQPLVHITTGQTVPDDIEVADGEAVARWLLREWLPPAPVADAAAATVPRPKGGGAEGGGPA